MGYLSFFGDHAAADIKIIAGEMIPGISFKGI